MTQIKNIIFDLGGVLLDVDYHKTADAFKLLGVHQFDDLYSQANANTLFEELETGNIKEEDFYESIGQYCTPNTSRDQMTMAWNKILLDFRKSSLEYLKQLAKKYNLYLFSNTNSIHLSAFNKILSEQTGETSLDSFFTKSYYSHIIRKRKPYPETFEWLLKDANINGSETLFIDDSVKNIEGAKLAGIQPHLLIPGEKIEDLQLL